MDYSEFHENVVPKSCLPSDFGGDLDTVEALQENQGKELLRLRDFFIAEEKQANQKNAVSDNDVEES